jgi:hypothetical protein
MAAVRPEGAAAPAAVVKPPSNPAFPAAPRARPPLPSTRSLPAAVPPPSSSKTTPRAGVVPPPPSSSQTSPISSRAAVPPAVVAPPAAPVATLEGVRKSTPPVSKSWLPPPPPAARRESVLPAATPSTFPGFDEGSIAFAFDALMSEGTSGLAGTHTVDLAPVRELFAELAANHMRHVRDFMIDVKWGEATRDWIEICVPAVVSLRRAAERLDLTDLALGLDRFGAQLRATSSDTSRTIEGTSKERLLDEYDQLVALLPQAFALDRDRSQREAVIIQSLCLSVPDVRKVTIDKLHAAGLTSLQTLFAAKPDEVAQGAGIPESLAQRIVERFQAYRSELQNASPQDARASERERMTVLTAQLLEQHNGYEEASKSWAPDAKTRKRDLFRGREETWLAISLLLARFGEVDRLQGIEKVPFAQRIAQLTDYLEEAREKYRSE